MEEKGKEAPQVRLVTQAPSPPTAVGGLGLSRSGPKPTQVPPNPPSCFPNDLWPETNLIILQARKQFPYQTHTLELCKHITSEMTPLFCKAVKAGRMKAGAVHHEGLGGMEDLLHSLLVYNDDGPRTGFGLSDQTYRLGDRVRQSDEWLAQVKAIAEVSAELSASAVESKPMKAAVGKPTLEKKEVHRSATIRLTEREESLLNVIQRMSKGRQYCREVDGAGIRIQRTGVWKGAPPTYLAAYDAGKPWRHRIEDEKSKIKRKAKLAKLATKLASE
jgi:hypothetical protein